MVDLHPPKREGQWVRPAARWPAAPRWGHASGLQIGLHPLGGPRGLLRIYTPYLSLPDDHVINFIAVEPIPVGESRRGYSELEESKLDRVAGKRFWSSDDLDDTGPRSPTRPARGLVGEDSLEIAIGVEKFDNGAAVCLLARFVAGRPHEVSLSVVRRARSTELKTCILTATMGNYARLRRLHLAEREIAPGELWPGFSGSGFTEHAGFALPELTHDADGAVTVSATPDEVDPAAATYATDVAEHWRYRGERARQRWTVREPSAELMAQVNARRVYWGGNAPIPGGPAYENIELVEPFADRQEFTFAVEPLTNGSGRT